MLTPAQVTAFEEDGYVCIDALEHPEGLTEAELLAAERTFDRLVHEQGKRGRTLGVSAPTAPGCRRRCQEGTNTDNSHLRSIPEAAPRR